MLNLSNKTSPDSFSSRISLILIGLTCKLHFTQFKHCRPIYLHLLPTGFFTIVFNVLMFFYEEELYSLKVPLYALILLIVTLVIIIGLYICLQRQPKITPTASFKVPFVPLLPLLSVFSNTYLMVHLEEFTWIRFFVWMVIGFAIYFSYGIVKSVGYLTTEERNRLSLDSPAEEILPEED